MEKTITINSPNSITPEKKLTQTNAAKKAAVQSILEKYNLKTPKKSKTNAVPVEYEIKPKDASQIIHVSKSAPSTPNQSGISYSSTPVEPHNIKIESSNVIETKSAPTSPHPQSSTIQRYIEQSREPTPTKHISTIDKSSILEKTKMVSVKELLERDKTSREAKKNEMPPAIIQKSSGGGGGTQDKINIYNFIPKVRPSLQETPTTTQVNAKAIGSSNIISKSGSNNNAGNIKRVSINPNLNEEESLNYTGSETKSIKASEELAARVIQEARSRTPSPIRSIQNEKHNERQTEKIQKSINYNLPSGEHRQALPIAERNCRADLVSPRQIQIQTSASGKQARALRAIQPHQVNISLQSQQRQSKEELDNMEGENSELNYLEAQRKELQRQQLLELQRFKQKKAEIIKLNNRKKEIELMRSIEEEKNKLRKIHAKQQELNEIYKSAVEKDSASKTQAGGTTMKRLVANDFDVDAKRTKKNLAGVSVSMIAKNKNKFIEPTETANIRSGQLKHVNVSGCVSTGIVDKVVLETSIKSKSNSVIVDEGIVEVVQSKSKNQNTLESLNGDNVAVKDVESKEKSIDTSKSKQMPMSNPKIKNVLVPGETLKYYTRKDKKGSAVSWPSKTELYDTSKFEDTLDVFLGVEPFFNRKQNKIKISHDEIMKELKAAYGFQKLDKFKPDLLEVLYKIIVGDRIKFTFE